jgi:hypothetical protein
MPDPYQLGRRLAILDFESLPDIEGVIADVNARRARGERP